MVAIEGTREKEIEQRRSRSETEREQFSEAKRVMYNHVPRGLALEDFFEVAGVALEEDGVGVNLLVGLHSKCFAHRVPSSPNRHMLGGARISSILIVRISLLMPWCGYC